MPYFTGRFVYSLGRRQDSNSASSKGVTARREKPRILLLDRFQKKRPRVRTRSKTKVPKTTAMMIQILLSIISSAGGKVGSIEWLKRKEVVQFDTFQ
jgi:hypothetical protein